MSTIEDPCHLMDVGVFPILAIRRSRSAAHSTSSRPLLLVCREPHKDALELKSPPMINLSTRLDNAPESSSNTALKSGSPKLGEIYTETNIYGPHSTTTNFDPCLINLHLILSKLGSQDIAALPSLLEYQLSPQGRHSVLRSTEHLPRVPLRVVAINPTQVYCY